jgi:PST family polysaccharide transporter
VRLELRAAAGALWLSAESWGKQLLQFVLFVILARLLGPEAYGLLAMAILVTAIGDVLITYGGWSEALIQRPDLDARHTDTVFWFLLAMGGGLALVAMGLAAPVAAAFREPELAGLIVWLSLTLPLASLCVVPEALLRRELRFAPLAARSLLATLGAGLVAVPIALAGFGVWSLVAYQLAQPLIQAVVLWLAYPWRPRLHFSGRQLQEIMRYTGGVLGERVMGVLDVMILRTMVGYALGPVALGHFTSARKILDLMQQMLIRPVSHVAMPSFAGARGSAARMRDLLTFGSQFAALVAFPGFIGLALIAPDLIPLVLGPSWAPSIPVFQVLTLPGLILPLTLLCTALMHGTARVGWQLALASGSTTLFVCLLALFRPAGLVGMAAAFVASTYLCFPLRLYVVHRTTGLDVVPAILGLLRLLLAAGLMAAAVLLWQGMRPETLDPILSIAGSALVGAAAYAGAVLALAQPLIRRAVNLLRSIASLSSARPADAAPGS